MTAPASQNLETLLPPYVLQQLRKCVEIAGGTPLGQLVLAVRNHSLALQGATEQLQQPLGATRRSVVKDKVDPNLSRFRLNVDDAVRNSSKLRPALITPTKPRNRYRGKASSLTYPYVTYHKGRKGSPYSAQVGVPAALRKHYPTWPVVAHGGYHISELAAAKAGYAIKAWLDRELEAIGVTPAHAITSHDEKYRVKLSDFERAAVGARSAEQFQHLATSEAFRDHVFTRSDTIDEKDLHVRTPNDNGTYSGGSVYKGVRHFGNNYRVQASMTPLIERVFGVQQTIYLRQTSDELEAARIATAARLTVQEATEQLRTYLEDHGAELDFYRC